MKSQVFAQGEESSQVDASLDELVNSWRELDLELATKEQQFKAATEQSVQEDLKGQYSALVKKSENLVAQIRTKAGEVLDAGSLDDATSKILVGLIMNDAAYQRHNEAIKLGDRYIAAGGEGSYLELAAKADRLSLYSKELMEELYVRFNQTKQNDLPQVKIATSKGEMVVELFEDEAPNTVANFVSLVKSKFYNGLTFHRVMEGFVAQGGDPNGNGSGGPGYSIKCECELPEARRHFIGSLSMAHAGKDSGGSQFFICLSRTSNLDGGHTVFGRVISGIDVLDRLSRNYSQDNTPIEGSDTDKIESMEVVRDRGHEYKVVKKLDEKPAEEDTPPTQPETTREPEDPGSKESADNSESDAEENSKESSGTEPEGSDGATETEQSEGGAESDDDSNDG